MEELQKVKRTNPIKFQYRLYKQLNWKEEIRQKKELATQKHLFGINNKLDAQIKSEILRLESKLVKTSTEILMLCLLKFRQIRSILRQIPRNQEGWLNFQVQLVKKKIGGIKYLSDKDIKKIIVHVRKINANTYKYVAPVIDPSLPSCYYWNVEEVGQWLKSIGHYNLKEMFSNNGISGRKLITIDASALSKMGIKYFDDIQSLTGKIREILKIHPPNMMRAIMRKVPFEYYLKQRQWNGKTYDRLTFEKFCIKNGYPYDILRENPLALIECTCELTIYMSTLANGKFIDDDESLSDHNSLFLAPTVEFNVRHILIRDKVVSELIDELLKLGNNTASNKNEGDASRLKGIFESGFEYLQLSPEELGKRLEFGRLVAEEMLREAQRTQEVLQDITKFRKYLKDENISEETIQRMRDVATEFFNSAANIGSLMAFGELDLDHIFRQQPEFNAFVNEIINEAESKLNDTVPEAEVFVEEILTEAKRRVASMHLPYLSEETLSTVRSHGSFILDDMSAQGVLSVEEARRQNSKPEGTEHTAQTPSMRSSSLDLGGDNTFEQPHDSGPYATTIAYFTVQHDTLRGEALVKTLEDSQTQQKTQAFEMNSIMHEGSGDTTAVRNNDSTKKNQVDKESKNIMQQAETSQVIVLSDDSTEDPGLGQLDRVLTSGNQEEEPFFANLILDQVIQEVIQEALTIALDDTDSIEEARLIMFCLEEIKTTAKPNIA